MNVRSNGPLHSNMMIDMHRPSLPVHLYSDERYLPEHFCAVRDVTTHSSK